jgi:TRAP-type C4-dicarboxylate transport system permease small subunit
LRRYVRIFNGAVAIVFLVVLSYFSIEMVIIEHITTLGSMDIPASVVRVPATIGGALMVIFIVLRWVYRLPAERAAMGEAFDDSEESM